MSKDVWHMQEFLFFMVRERENSNLNLKTLFYNDCSLGPVRNLSND